MAEEQQMSARARAVKAVEEALLNAALSTSDRAERIVREIEQAGVELTARVGALQLTDRDGDVWTELGPDRWWSFTQPDSASPDEDEGMRRQAIETAWGPVTEQWVTS